jgi:hypothetical protein
MAERIETAERVTQEFFCHRCPPEPDAGGAGRGGFILLRLNPQYNHLITFVCPNPRCGARHSRNVVDGVIQQAGREGDGPREELYPTRSAWSPTPRSKKIRAAVAASSYRPGDAAVIASEDDWIRPGPARDAALVRADTMRDAWLEHHGDKL